LALDIRVVALGCLPQMLLCGQSPFAATIAPGVPAMRT